MKLIPVVENDLPLYESMFTDETYMADLGGAVDKEQALTILQKHILHIESGRGIVLKIIPTEGLDYSACDYDSRALAILLSGFGSVCLWKMESEGKETTEVGWGILPEFQGKGFGTKAVMALIEYARIDGKEKWGTLHASTGVGNVASNKLCKKLGFSFLSDFNMEFYGKFIKANRYELS